MNLADADAAARSGAVCAAERRFGMLSSADTNASDAFQVAGPEACVEAASRRNKDGHILCRHNRRLYFCVDCGGGGICAHKRLRHNCSMCKSGGKGKSGGIAKRCEQGGERRGGTAAAAPAVRRDKHGNVLCRHNHNQ